MSKLETIFWASVTASAAMLLEPFIPPWLYAVGFGLWVALALYLALTHDFGGLASWD